MDGERPRPDPESVDRRSVLKAGFAVAILGVAGGSLASYTTTGRRSSSAGSPSEVATTSATTLPPAADPTSTPDAPAVEITHGPASASGVALTFHGAGDVALATKLLGELEAA